MRLALAAAAMLAFLLVPALTAGSGIAVPSETSALPMETMLHAWFGVDGNTTRQHLQVPEPKQATESTGSCADAVQDPLGDATWILPFGAGAVESDFMENGQPRFHPEQGLAHSITLEAATLHWVLDLPDDSHLAVPLRIEAKVVATGAPDPETRASAPTVAKGSSADLALPAGTHEIDVALQVVDGGEVSKADGFTLRVDLRDSKDCASPDGMRIQAVSRDGARSRLEMNTKEGVYIDFVHPEVAAGVVLIHTAFNSPFGASDLDIGNATILIEGPSVVLDLQKVMSQNARVHDMHDKSTEVTWIWRYRDQEAADGQYNVTLTIWDVAHTATATEQARVVIEGGGHSAYGIDNSGNTVAPAAGVQAAPGAALGLMVFLPLAALRAKRSRDFPLAISS